MNVSIAALRIGVLLMLLSLVAIVSTAQCTGPLRTLSSDCRHAGVNYGKVCIAYEPDISSPCSSGYVENFMECAGANGKTCDVPSYLINSRSAQARFHIKFPGDRWSSTLTRGLLSRGVTAAMEKSAPAPPRLLQSSEPGSLVPSQSPKVSTPRLLRVLPFLPTRPSDSRSGSADDDITPLTPTPADSTPVPTFTPPGGSLVDFEPSAGSPDAYVPFVSSEFIDTIGQLRLAPVVKEMRIVGGRSEFGTRGSVVKLRIDPLILKQSPQISSLWIANCAVGEQVASGDLFSGLPSGMTELNLRNTQTRSEPTGLSTLPNLQSLKLEQNELTTFSNKISLPNLRTLDLSDNVLTSFDANLPALEILKLNKNKFNTVPKVVYSMSKLQELHMEANPIGAFAFSETEYQFLEKRTFRFDGQLVPPPQPVVLVPGPTDPAAPVGPIASGSTAFPATPSVPGANFPLPNGTSLNASNTIAVPVGTLVYLNGVPVWKVPDKVFDIFTKQQETIATSNVIYEGKKLQSYQEMAKAAVAVSTPPPWPATDATARTEPLQSLQPNGNAPSREDDRSGSEETATSPVQMPSSTSALAPQVDRTPTTNVDGTFPSSDPADAVSSTTTTQGTSDHSLTILLITAAAVATVAAVVMFARYRRRSNSKTATNSVATASTPRADSSTCSFNVMGDSPIPSQTVTISTATTESSSVKNLFASRRIRMMDIEDIRHIGSGTGVTWLVNLRGSRLLASKRVIGASSHSQRMTDFVNDIVIAADLDHPSIVQFVGVAWTDESDLQALFEYMPNGDLASYLSNTPPESLPWSSIKIQFAIDVIEALVYTYSFSPPLLHRDLRAKNVLLDEEMRPKLSNFASARFMSEQNTMTTDGIGSARWLAPEILRGSTNYDAASDVYAFGVLLCELDTHVAPYADVADVNGRMMADTWVLDRVARGELRPTLSMACPPEVIELANRCLSQDPQVRPLAMQVAYELRVLSRAWEQG